MKYSVVVIIYNPNSTGNSRQRADQLAHQLREASPKSKVRLRASKHKGHAETIALRTAMVARHALIVSVSGDGGYNDVINGVLRARALGRRVTAGLLPAGNANDHYASMHRGDFVQRVVDNDEDRIDALRLTAKTSTRRMRRYGHSYIGIGLTPEASQRLNATKLDLWQEVKIVTRVLLHPKAVKVLVDGETRRYDSLIFSNVGRMSKVIRVPAFSSNKDGTFEISSIYFRNKFKLIGALAQAALLGLQTVAHAASFQFSTLRSLPVQIDGEVIRIDPGADVTVEIMPGAIDCIV